MSDEPKRDPAVGRLIPGEPVPQFGGMTPEQFGDFAGNVSEMLHSVFRSRDGMLSLYSHLACCMFLLVENVAGQAQAQEAQRVFIACINDEMALHRKAMAMQRETDPGLN